MQDSGDQRPTFRKTSPSVFFYFVLLCKKGADNILSLPENGVDRAIRLRLAVFLGFPYSSRF